jgi:hypothetical protein
MFGASVEVLELLAERERIDAALLQTARLVRNARLVHKHERTAKMLDAGDTTAAHVDVMARAARHRKEGFDDHEETLLVAARALPVLVVVCRRHHVACHEGRWKLQRQADGTIEAIPP